jgi:hypothetical protein
MLNVIMLNVILLNVVMLNGLGEKTERKDL